MESKSAEPSREADGNAELRPAGELSANRGSSTNSMRSRRYTDEQLCEAVSTSTSIRQVLAKLGLVEAGGNYVAIKQQIVRLGLGTEHLTGQGWKRGNNAPVVPAAPIESLLRVGVAVQSYKLKRRLFKEGLKELRCERCQQTEWLGLPIPLELDHLNGDPTDNRLENLRILCPNCHASTNAYRGKKRAKCRDETAPS
jgi:hypothetical protein